MKYIPAKEALAMIRSGMRVFVHGSAATPTHLIETLAAHSDHLKDVELIFISVLGNFPVAAPELRDRFRLNALFVSGPVREAVKEGRGDYVPVFLSEIPELLRDQLKPDVALVQVSEPDRHGYCSLGVSVDIARSAVLHATNVIALVNPRMPRTHGDGMIHHTRFSAMVYHDSPLHENPLCEPTETEHAIAGHISGLIEDRSTLQMGIGSIPDAVLSALTNHQDLGIHTEMFSDGILPLIKKGVITNAYKKTHPGRIVTGFCLGTSELYSYVHDNPAIAFLDIDYVNDSAVIRRNPKVVAINSCVEIDLTGQVCSDSIGTYQYSGVGGQMDFMRGAALSEGGKPIIALSSRTSKGISRIVPYLKEGAGVVTTRAHIHYVITEYGSVYLFGKNLRQRGAALISIAHPDNREKLEQSFYERYKEMPKGL